MRHQVRVGDQHPRRVGVGAEDADRLAGLDQQRLVGLELLQRRDDAVEVVPGPRRPADAAVDHELVRVLGHVGVQVVHQHPHRRLGQPGLGADLGAGRRVDVAGVVARVGHRRSPEVGAAQVTAERSRGIERGEDARAAGAARLRGRGRGRRLGGEIGRLRQLHLDRVHAFLRPAVVARGPAALEAAVQHVAVAGGGAAERHDAAASSAGSQLAPSLVPTLRSGSVPSNRNGISLRIEWQS